jgi:dolichol-phosphate mannosyltransferase
MHGIRNAASAVIVVMDADLSHPPESIPDLVRPLLAGLCEMTVGSRYVGGGGIDRGWGWCRHLNSRVATLLARPLTPIRDCMSGFFALHRQLLDDADPITPIGYKVLLELIVKCRPARVREIPIRFGERWGGSSKLSWRERANYLRHLGHLYGYEFHGSGRRAWPSK